MKLLLYAVILLLLAFLVWPFTVIYRLDQALQTNDRVVIDRLVDIQSIQLQIKRKMNKEVESTIGDVSNSFVEWLQNGIQRLGNDAIEHMVNTDWVLVQLRSHNPDPRVGGFIGPPRLCLLRCSGQPVAAHRRSWRRIPCMPA